MYILADFLHPARGGRTFALTENKSECIIVKSEIRKKTGESNACDIFISILFRMNARGFCYHKKNA